MHRPTVGCNLSLLTVAVLLAELSVVGCQVSVGKGGSRFGRLTQPATVVVYTSADQPFAEPVLQAYKAKTGIDVRMVFDTEETKTTGLVNRLQAEQSNPRADVFWSSDPARGIAITRIGLAQPYRSPNGATVPATFKHPEGLWTGFAARARVRAGPLGPDGTRYRDRTA